MSAKDYAKDIETNRLTITRSAKQQKQECFLVPVTFLLMKFYIIKQRLAFGIGKQPTDPVILYSK